MKARFIIPAYVPGNYTHAFSPPDQLVQKELKASNATQFSVWYGNEITTQCENGVPEDEVWVDFTLSNMKAIHAKWTINSYEAMRNRKDLLQKAWELTGLWSVIQRTFKPTTNVPKVYDDPSPHNDEPAYASESEYTSAESEGEVDQSLWGGSDGENDAAEVLPQAPKRRKQRVVLESDDDSNQKPSAPSSPTSPVQKALPKRRRTAVSEAIRKEEEDLAIAITQSLQSIEAPTETSSTGVTMVSERSTLEEEDDDKVIVVQSNMCLTENWVCIFVDFVWQEQKVSLFGKGAPPIRGKHALT